MSVVADDRRGTHPVPSSPSGFLVRLTAATGGGMFLDGFVYAAIAAVIAGQVFISDLNLSSAMLGAISASTLIGTAIGSTVIGYITDRIGRKPMFLLDICIFLGGSILMVFVGAGWQVVILGLILGIAIGGDYSIGSPLLGEFTPKHNRGHYLGLLEILWNVGYVLSFLIGFLVLRAFPHAWNIVLASAAVPAGIILLIRHGLPESPRWLLSKGRAEDAQEILDQLGEHRDAEEFHLEEEEKTDWRTLFAPAYVARTVFCCVFWICIVVPYFALTFFQSEVLRIIGLTDPVSTALIGTCVALVGAAIGWFLVDRIGRRLLLIVPMFVTGGFLALVALHQVIGLPTGVTVVCFFGYLLFYGLMSILPGIYRWRCSPRPCARRGRASPPRRRGSARRSAPSSSRCASWPSDCRPC